MPTLLLSYRASYCYLYHLPFGIGEGILYFKHGCKVELSSALMKEKHIGPSEWFCHIGFMCMKNSKELFKEETVPNCTINRCE